MNKWINVNDQLPRSGDRVLVVCTNPNNKMQEHISICSFTHWAGEKTYWSGRKQVTYWMPLPALPKEN